MKVKTVGEVLMGPKHKAAERCAIFDPVTEELITDENEILSTTQKYNKCLRMHWLVTIYTI